MFYKITNRSNGEEKLYNFKKINYISREGNRLLIYYDTWCDELEIENKEELEDFINELHKILNRRGILRRLLDIFI